MKIQEIMTTPVVVGNGTDTMARARNLMLRHNVSRIVVVENKGKPIGVITHKDMVNIINKNTPIWRRRTLDSVTIKNVMSTNLVTEAPEADVIEAVIKLKETGYSALPIVNRNKLVGILSKTDIIRALPSLIDRGVQVKAFMSRPVITAKTTHSILHIHDLMTEKNISRVVILEKDKPVGIITSKDLAYVKQRDLMTGLTEKGRQLDQAGKVRRTLYRYPGTLLLLSEEVMSRNLITVAQNQSVIKAAEYMTKHDIGGLPVLEDEETSRQVGIITKRDIINNMVGGKRR